MWCVNVSQVKIFKNLNFWARKNETESEYLLVSIDAVKHKDVNQTVVILVQSSVLSRFISRKDRLEISWSEQNVSAGLGPFMQNIGGVLGLGPTNGVYFENLYFCITYLHQDLTINDGLT